MQADKPKLDDFEGLVFTTARMFASMVKMEEEDLRQELRVKVWWAMERYDPSRTRVGLKNFVYGCVANKIKDYKRNAARRAAYGLEFSHIEDHTSGETPTLDSFTGHYMSVGHDNVYGRIDEGLLTLPATVTQTEAQIVVLLMFGMTNTEIMVRMALPRPGVETAIASVRVKMADWHPGSTSAPAQTVALSLAA